MLPLSLVLISNFHVLCVPFKLMLLFKYLTHWKKEYLACFLPDKKHYVDATYSLEQKNVNIFKRGLLK